jgi:LSD1 subclass zinc finger protein
MVLIACARCRAQVSSPPGAHSVTCPYCNNVNMAYGAPPGMMAAYPTAMVAPMQAKCSRAVFVVLALFLGMFGVHNFVAGYTGRGVAKLLITLFAGWLIVPLLGVALWVLIEICSVSCDSDGVRMS